MTALNDRFEGSRAGICARLVALALIALAGPALAENTLQDVRYTAGAGGKVDITLQFAQPPGDVQAFTTDAPPRIAIDLPSTKNGFAKRRLAVGNGATSAVSTAEAGGRTRVVVDLFRPAGYETRVQGNNLILSVEGGGAAAVAGKQPALANPADPAKRVPATLSVSNIDFKRGENGAGRLVMRFSGDGAAPDMRSEESRVVVDVGNASLPATLQRRLDVGDFATPARTIEPRTSNGGTHLVINTAGAYESMAYQTGNEYVVEIAPKARAAESPATVGALLAPRYTGKPVTFNFQDVPVRTVLQLIAEESNLNIVASDSVQGNVTLRLVNVPWDQALDIVLRAKSLDRRKDGNVMWVAPQSELATYEQAREDARIALEQRAELVTEYIPINYGNAEDIAKLLTEESKNSQGGGGGAGAGGQQSRGFLSPRGSITFDRRTNTLLVIDIPNKLEEVKQLVALLDKPVDQVLIEARIVIATESFARELGAKFGYFRNALNENGEGVITDGDLTSTDNFRDTLIEDGIGEILRPGGLNVNMPVVNPAGSLALSILGSSYILDLELSALQAEGRGEVISNPRIITSNQREAVIRQGDEVGYVTIQPAAAGQLPTPNVQFKDVLLELKVTPTITQDGRVFMAMQVKKDEIIDFIDTAIGDVPQIAKREVNTAVLVENGQTVVIGGVYEFSSRESVRKVPFLGDIPFLGALFRNKTKNNEKAELLVFVTPKILQVAGKR